MEKHYCDNCKKELSIDSNIIKFEWVSKELNISTGKREFDSIVCLEKFIKEVQYELGLIESD